MASSAFLRRMRSLPQALAGAALATALAGTAEVRASPPQDEWSLEHGGSDALLVQQRLSKLRKNPFDGKQWRALERAIGKKQLAQRLKVASQRTPGDVALAILSARASWALGDPADAAARLQAIEPRAGRWRARCFALRIDALEDARLDAQAVAALTEAADGASADKARAHLRRAYTIADKSGLKPDALRIALSLAQSEPHDVDARLRVADAAAAAGDSKLADDAYVRAIELARASQRPDLVARRARARLDSGAAEQAATLLWELLVDPGQGRALQRESWWGLLEGAHRRAASSEALAEQLARWLDKPIHAREAGAWRALARARSVAGMDPVPAWRRALQADPRDSESRAALIEALEAAGDSKGALDEYRELVARSPQEAQLGLDMAMRLITNGERPAGLEIAREIEARAGKRDHTLLLLLEFYNDLEEPDRALEIARKLVRVQPRNADARVALGEQLFQMGHQQEAMEHWAQLPVLVRPAHAGWARYAEILSEHAAPHADHHLRRRAEDALKRALAAAPEQPRYLRLRAVLHEEDSSATLAYETWQKVRLLATRPEDRLLREEARTRVVELLVNGKKLKDRVRDRHRAVTEAQAQLLRGPSPEALEAGLFLAELYTRDERYDEAVKQLSELNEMFPNDADLLVQLGTAQRRYGQIEQAMETLRQVMEIDPGRRAEVLTELSELSFTAGDIDQALATATRAAAGGIDGRRALIRLGELHERNGDLDRALEAYKTALQSDPLDVSARLRIAELQLTKGDTQGAVDTLGKILETGGPAELLRRAGHRALDLAEAAGDTQALLALAVRRTQREPENDEPREFLLDTLDRTAPADVEAWLNGATSARQDGRVASLRRPLLAALSRGSIGVRLRAAQHLGRLRLPETALVLARTGSQLTTPRDATQAVRDAFENARAASIRAAGSQADPAATAVLVDILAHTRFGSEKIAAAWALALSPEPAAVAALRKEMTVASQNPQVTALACIGVGRHSRGDERGQDRVRAAELAQRRAGAVRHACAFAEASLMSDRRALALIERLDHGDPILAAIAAWRLGRSDRRGVGPELVQALLERYLGPSGLPRDATGAALARLLGGQEPRAAPLPELGSDWELALTRWITQQVSPDHDPIRVAALAPHREQLAKALAANESGTPAERLASERARASCADAGVPERDEVCLAPLVREVVPLPTRVDK